MIPTGPKKLPYNGGVLRHWGCRSTETPETMTWRELGIDADEIPEGTRQSMNGELPESMTADQWLKSQYKSNPQMVEKVFGKNKARLYAEGRLTSKQMIDQNGRPMTLAQLMERDPALLGFGGAVSPHPEAMGGVLLQ